MGWLFGGGANSEKEKVKKLRLQYKGTLGPKDAMQYVEERFNVTITQDVLRKEIGINDHSKNSTTTYELDTWMAHVAQAQPALLTGGVIHTPSGSFTSHGYNKKWKHVFVDF